MLVCVLHINVENLTFKCKLVFFMDLRAVPGTPAGIRALMMVMMMMVMATMTMTMKMTRRERELPRNSVS